MKTQMLKNSIIVPVGSKGGFVLKGAVGLQTGQATALEDRYREFIAGLLDVTDNRVNGAIAHPPAVVRYDDDDPYLVVAADKGTAHLSDTANQVSAQYRLLARRRVRVRRQQRLRPQEGRDHGARRVGVGGASLPPDRDRSGPPAVHGRRHRRHVRRRVRQRSAAEPDDEAGRRLQPSAHLSRSRSRSGGQLQRAAAAVPAAAIDVGRLRPRRPRPRRRGLRAAGEDDSAQPARQDAARHRRR